MKVLVREAPGYKLEIYGDMGILNKMKIELFEGKVVTVYRIPRGPKKGQLKRDVKIECLATTDWIRKCLILDRGFLQEIVLWLFGLKSKFPELEYKIEAKIFGDIELLDKWKERYLNYDEDQYEAARLMLKYKSSCIQYPTGLGKTEIFLGIVESYLATHEGNVIITSGKNAIADSILERMKRWGIEYPDRIKVINPIGFCNSKKVEDPNILKWLLDVKLLIVDEMHHSGANSYAKLFSLCKFLEYVYGFSATISLDNIINFSKFSALDLEARTMIGRTGSCVLQLLPKDKARKISYYRVNGHFGLGPEDADIFFNHCKTLCSSLSFRKCLKNLIEEHYDLTFFSNIPLAEDGLELVKWLNANGINVIHWSSGSVYPNLDNYEGLNSFDKVKSALKSGNFRCLIATSVAGEGVDIPCLNAAILSVSKDWKASLQSLGRSGRGADAEPTVFNICNLDSPVLRKQFNERNSVIRKTYLINKFSTINYEED